MKENQRTRKETRRRKIGRTGGNRASRLGKHLSDTEYSMYRVSSRPPSAVLLLYCVCTPFSVQYRASACGGRQVEMKSTPRPPPTRTRNRADRQVLRSRTLSRAQSQRQRQPAWLEVDKGDGHVIVIVLSIRRREVVLCQLVARYSTE